MQGSVIIGRTLDIGVASSVEASDVAAGLCLRADVDYGDGRLPATLVSVEVERLGAANAGLLRVRANRQVNEPLVSVTLSVGCTQQFTRTYTLLADVEPVAVPAPSLPAVAVPAAPVAPAAPAAPVARAPLPVASTVPPPAAASAPRPSASSPAVASAPTQAVAAAAPVLIDPPAPRPENVVPRSKVRPGTVLSKMAVGVVAPGASAAAPTPALTPTPTPAPNPAPVPPAPTPAPGPRLELTPLELGAVPSTGSVLQGAAPEAAPVVGEAGSGGLPGAPGTDEAGTPGDAPLASDAEQASQRLVALENELAQVRAEQERLRLALETVNSELTQTREQTTSNAVVYGLVAMLLLLLGVLVWLLRSRSAALAPVGLGGSGVGTGFGATSLPDGAVASPAGVSTGAEPARAAPATTAGTAPWWADSNSAPVQASGFSAVELDSQPSDSALGFSRTEIEANSLPLMAQDLADLVRQVEFFEVLGQSQEAIDALAAFVKTHPAQSELPYLLLMQVIQKQDPEQLPDLQRLYMRHYDQPAPQPSDCDPDAPGLLEDPIWITRLQQVWPHAAAGTALQSALTAPPAQNLLRRRTLPVLLDVVALYEVWCALHEADEATPTSGSTEAAPAYAPVPQAEFPAVDIDIDLTAYTTAAQPGQPTATAQVPAGAASDAAPGPATPQADSRELPALDFDVGDFPEAPDSRLGGDKGTAPKS